MKPIYELTRKEQPFIWTEFHQKAFDYVKELLVKPPVVTLAPDPVVDLFYIAILQRGIQAVLFGKMQDRKPRLLGYASKSLPDACQNYSITESGNDKD